MRKISKSDLVAEKLGIITLCKYCHKRIHLEVAERYEYGKLNEPYGDYIWVHETNFTCCGPENLTWKELAIRFSEDRRYKYAVPRNINY